MADVFTKKKRSAVMAAIRSVGNKATELSLLSLLRQHGITGWRRHQALPGRPDFLFRRERLAGFVDGCFWHGCKKHLRMPASNVEYWQKKIARNLARDRAASRLLRQGQWRVLRIWEHELREPERVLRRVRAALAQSLSPVNLAAPKRGKRTTVQTAPRMAKKLPL